MLRASSARESAARVVRCVFTALKILTLEYRCELRNNFESCPLSEVALTRRWSDLLQDGAGVLWRCCNVAPLDGKETPFTAC